VSLAGAAELPLTYVGNCAEAIVAAAEAPEGGWVVNVVDDDRLTRAAYLRALARAATPSPLVVDLPWAVLRAGGRSANLVGVHAGMLHPARLAARCQPLRYTNAAARALGWRRGSRWPTRWRDLTAEPTPALRSGRRQAVGDEVPRAPRAP
jgi:nucleoside-diphosphate-sugar epimerase